MKELSITEQLMYVTTRVECTKLNGDCCVATAFFCKLYVDKDRYVEVLVSNRHVFENLQEITLHISKLNEKEDEIDGFVNYRYVVKDRRFLILHPDSNVDLALLLVNGIFFDVYRQIGRKVYFKSVSSEQIANFSSDKYDAVEEVLMVGYPNGIWDNVNNRPVIRRGITATDPKSNYLGKSEFLIDCACIEGSSGSPIFSVHKGVSVDKFGNVSVGGGQTIELLGIQYAIPIKNMYANIELVSSTVSKPVTHIQLPVNLGYIIKADRLKDFIPILKKMIEQNQSAK